MSGDDIRDALDDVLGADAVNDAPNPAALRRGLYLLAREVRHAKSDLRATRWLLVTTSVGFLGSLVALVMNLIGD
jgi:hypothetical protein